MPMGRGVLRLVGRIPYRGEHGYSDLLRLGFAHDWSDGARPIGVEIIDHKGMSPAVPSTVILAHVGMVRREIVVAMRDHFGIV